jgi:hypothetical protein
MKMFQKPRIYLMVMAAYWFVFGLITTFYPKLMDLFQTTAGIDAKSGFSNHVWAHDGLDILSFCILLFALSREPVSSGMLRAVAFAGLLPTLGIFYSFFTTPYWAPFFLVPGFGCLAFSVWGFVLAGQSRKSLVRSKGES